MCRMFAETGPAGFVQMTHDDSKIEQLVFLLTNGDFYGPLRVGMWSFEDLLSPFGALVGQE